MPVTTAITSPRTDFPASFCHRCWHSWLTGSGWVAAPWSPTKNLEFGKSPNIELWFRCWKRLKSRTALKLAWGVRGEGTREGSLERGTSWMSQNELEVARAFQAEGIEKQKARLKRWVCVNVKAFYCCWSLMWDRGVRRNEIGSGVRELHYTILRNFNFILDCHWMKGWSRRQRTCVNDP